MGSIVKELEGLHKEVEVARGLINQHHIGANLDEARSLLKEAAESVKKKEFARALELAKKAQLAARPTTEYLLDRAKKIADDGSEAYQREDYSEAIKLWERALEEYTRVVQLASERNEAEIVEALKPSMESIEKDIKTAAVNRARKEMAALVDEANKTVNEAKRMFEAGDFDAAREGFRSARETYAKGAGVAGKFGFEDEPTINRAVANMEVSIEACLLHKGDKLIEQANKEKGKEKENAFSEVIKYLESFSSDNATYDQLKTTAYRGLVEGKIEIGNGLIEDAEKWFNKGEYLKARDQYRNAQTHFEGIRELAAEHGLEEEKTRIEKSTDACTANIRLCTDTLVRARSTVAKDDEVRKPIKVEDITLEPAVGPGIRKGQPMFAFPEELHEYYHQPEYVGEGGSSWVYRAQRKKDGAMVAIKIARYHDKKTAKSFIDEIQIWKELDHKNIATIYDYSSYPRPYIEMELLAGSIEDLIPLDPRKAGHLIFKIADGLRYAHGRPTPVFHLDLKPGNIMLDGNKEPKIVDWGLAKMIRASKQSVGQARGYTMLYATPEHITEGKVDGRTDIFQLGQIFYELVTGKPPFEAASESAIIEKIKKHDPPLPSSINQEAKFVEPVIMRCLEKEKERRYQSIEELHNHLATILEIQTQKVKISIDRLERITVYCEMSDMLLRQAYSSSEHRETRLSALNKCIDYLNSLKTQVKSSETQDLIDRKIAALNYCVERDVILDPRRLDDMDRIIRKARTEG
ncbi:protein kinase [Dehalococcoidia bacterium]|nr:protein kinase [Dehalococcoidia bacterium]MCL0050833.1 protein kinase [Dehalococcoidia bacterium]MCL0070832.1 protein kinase [Dehalococcoidia bacterium]